MMLLWGNWIRIWVNQQFNRNKCCCFWKKSFYQPIIHPSTIILNVMINVIFVVHYIIGFILVNNNEQCSHVASYKEFQLANNEIYPLLMMMIKWFGLKSQFQLEEIFIHQIWNDWKLTRFIFLYFFRFR